MTRSIQSLTIALAAFTSIFASGCAESDDPSQDFGFAQDFAYGETGDEYGAEAGAEADAGEEDTGSMPGTPGYKENEAECGNGLIELDEECDDGADNGSEKSCTASCTYNICGDGLVFEEGEACDWGRLNGQEIDSAICTETCELILPE